MAGKKYMSKANILKTAGDEQQYLNGVTLPM